MATLAAGSAVLLAGQAPPANQEPQATFRSSVEAVQLSVIVTDSEGRPVSGLTEDDFEVLEGGATRPITTFSAVDIPIERVTRTASDVLSNEKPPGRLYVIALDRMGSESALRTRAFLRQFIETYLGPNDTAAVMLTTGGLRESGQEFTSSPRLLLNAIDRFDGGVPDMSVRLRERNFIGDFLNLMRFMSGLQGGRKALIFISENIPVDAYDVVDRGRARFGGLFSEVDTEWVDALSLATRNNVAIYPVDPRGLMTEGGAGLEERMGLNGLAEITGGFSLIGSNNYATAFERLVQENSTYYLLGFNSAVEYRDGRYVRVEVRVKRPGLQVRSTEGYVSPRGKIPPPGRRPETVLTATWDAVKSAITTSGVPMRIYAAPFKWREKDATVAIALEIGADKLNLVQQDGAYRGTLEVLFAVTDAKKKRWPIWRHRWGLALKPETYTRVSNGAMRVVSQLRLPSGGRYQLRASAGGAATAGSVVYDIEIPDFSKDFSLSGVALTSKQAAETFTFSPHASLDVTLPAPPTTAREFSRDDTLTVFAQAYEVRRKPHTVTFTIDLLDEAGKSLGTHVVERKADKPNQASAYTFAPNLALGEIPPGRYVLRVDARSSLDKGKGVSRDIPFSIR